MPWQSHTKSRGFTLVEACITVAILAMAAAVVVPAIGNVTLAQLRQASSQLAGTVKATYDSAALSGQNYRMTFDFKHPDVIKVQEGAAAGSSGSPFGGLASLVMGSALNGEGSSDDAPVEVPPPAELMAMLGGSLGDIGANADDGDLLEGSGFTPTKHDLQLPKDITVMDVWLEGMDKPANKGVVFLDFFSHGYTRNAIVHLTDDKGRIYSVKVFALTGKTQIFNEYIEVPK